MASMKNYEKTPAYKETVTKDNTPFLKKIGQAFASLKWYEIIMCIVMLAVAIYFMIFPTGWMPQWLAIINFISGLCGIVCVFFCAKANRMNFPFAVINTTVFMIYLAYFGIWATFWLEAIVYFPMNIISWVKWYKHKDEDDKLLAKSKKLNFWQHIIVFIIIAAITVLVFFALSNLAGTSWLKIANNFGWKPWAVQAMKWLDASIFAIGIVAVTLEMLRYKEQYVWWLVTDVIAVAQYAIYKDPVYTTKKAIYIIEAVIGLRNWHKLQQKNKSNE